MVPSDLRASAEARLFRWGERLSLIVFPLMFGVYSVILGQDSSWDFFNYHLYNPYAFLNNRLGLDLAPADMQSYYNPYIDVIYFWSINNYHPKTIGFLIGCIHGANYILLYYLSKTVIRSLSINKNFAMFLAAAGVLSIGFLSEIGTLFHDNLIALFCLTALLIIIVSIPRICSNDKRATLWVMAAGVIAGLGSGLKLVYGIYALALCLSFFAVPVLFKDRLKLALSFGGAVLFGFLISNGHWLWVLWREFGNPIFPYFNNIFEGELVRQTAMRDTRFLAGALIEKVFYPLIFTLQPERVSEYPYKQISWIMVYIALLWFLAGRAVKMVKRAIPYKPLSPQAAYLMAFFCLGYVLWLNLFAVYRYIVTLELILPLVFFTILASMTGRRRFLAGGLTIIVIMAAVNIKNVPDWGRSAWAEPAYRATAADLQSPQTAVIFLAGHPLGWLVPALDTNARFIQLIPYMEVSEAYWQRVGETIGDGDRYILFGLDIAADNAQLQKNLQKLGLSIDLVECRIMEAHIGRSAIPYRYCLVR